MEVGIKNFAKSGITLCLLLIVWAQGICQVQFSLQQLRKNRISSDSIQQTSIYKFLKGNSYPNLRPLTKDSTYLLSGIDKYGLPIFKAPLNAGAAVTTGVNTLQDQSLGLNLLGENMLVGIWDAGLVKDHIELGDRILSKEGLVIQNHSTHVAGTILAAGINASAKGMAPLATATTWYFDNDEAEMSSLAKSDQTGLLFSNHSYGIVTGWTIQSGNWVWTGDPSISNAEDYRHGFYGENAQLLDQMAYAAPYYTIVWAAGNDRTEVGDGTHPPDGNGGTGYDCIIPQSVAKNIITVGAVNKVASYIDASSVVMSSFSSWGPTDDGRIKPDLVGAGVNLFSLSSTGTNQYTTMSGTSMATPNVTGSLMLIQELYSKLHSGNFMKASTLKALAIHTIKEAGNFPGPDYSYGWGLLDVNAATKVLLNEDNQNTIIKEVNLKSGEGYSFTISPLANQKITATICWTDPAGTPVDASLDPSNLMLVNDLDIRIVDDVGNELMPWVLNPASPSTKAIVGDNFRDNVEKIEFNNPQTKRYTVRVTHKGTLFNGEQNFSLVVTLKSSISSGLNYYWIGNSGDWNDGSNWSLTTGGAAVNVMPTSNDNVIFDENSFDGISTRIVSLQSNSTCKKMIWLTDKTVELDLNSKTLTISDNLTMSSKNFKIRSSGIFLFKGSGSHFINIQRGDFSNASFNFEGGYWKLSGNLSVNKLEVISDSLKVNNNIKLNEINTHSKVYLDISNVLLDSITESTLTSTSILKSKGARIIISSDQSIIDWDKIYYEGELHILSGAAVKFIKSDTVGLLTIDKSSVINIANGTTQHVNQLSLNSDELNPIQINSEGKGVLNILDHKKYCFDYVHVSGVDVEGNSFVNVGLNSTITNAENWMETDCNTILFPDFLIQNTCEHGMTSFTDTSEGLVLSWLWDFGETGSILNTSTLQNPYHLYSSFGNFNVTLTISDAQSTKTFKKIIHISSDNSEGNEVVLSGGKLISLLQAETYQWYKNNEPIEDAIFRSYDYSGDIGNYTVVIPSSSDCNIAALPYVVTGLENIKSQIRISPNPAFDFIKINAPYSARVTVLDLVGHKLLNQIIVGDTNIDVRNINEGIYILDIELQNGHYQKKIIIAK